MWKNKMPKVEKDRIVKETRKAIVKKYQLGDRYECDSSVYSHSQR